jgi:hypothetical protein
VFDTSLPFGQHKVKLWDGFHHIFPFHLFVGFIPGDIAQVDDVRLLECSKVLNPKFAAKSVEIHVEFGRSLPARIALVMESKEAV